MKLSLGIEQDREDWADDHGYYRFRCPACGHMSWTDTYPACACGWDSKQEEKDDYAL